MNLVSTDGDVANVLTAEMAARAAVRTGEQLLASIVAGDGSPPLAGLEVDGSAPDDLRALRVLADQALAAASGRRVARGERGRWRAARRDAGCAIRVQARTVAGIFAILAALVWS